MKSSSFFTLFSVVLVLCLLGIYGIITLHANNISDILKENLNLIVELDSGIDDSTIARIQDQIKEIGQVKSESVRFVPKADALTIMNSELGDDYLLNADDNPFSDIVLFNVKYEFVDTSYLNKISAEVQEIEGVDKVSYYGTVYEYLTANVRKMSRVLLVIGLILGIFAFSLIYSTIQLSLYAERFKIRTMELVGASWNQIRKPFVGQSLRLAIWSTAISVGVLIVILLVIAIQFKHFWEVINIPYVLVIFLLMAVFAVFITQLASYFVVNRYLGAEKSRFY